MHTLPQMEIKLPDGFERFQTGDGIGVKFTTGAEVVPAKYLNVGFLASGLFWFSETVGPKGDEVKFGIWSVGQKKAVRSAMWADIDVSSGVVTLVRERQPAKPGGTSLDGGAPIVRSGKEQDAFQQVSVSSLA